LERKKYYHGYKWRLPIGVDSGHISLPINKGLTYNAAVQISGQNYHPVMYNVAAQIYKESGQNYHPIMYDVAAQIYKGSGHNYYPSMHNVAAQIFQEYGQSLLIRTQQ